MISVSIDSNEAMRPRADLIRKVGTVRKNGSARRGVWELTERARRILG
jgi:hypothetical protein